MANSPIYPTIELPLIKNPIRWYAVPFLGGIVKIIMLIPVGFWIFLLCIALGFVSVINSFVVLFSGKYWKVAYELTVMVISLGIKASYFMAGLTNNYPGFTAEINDFRITIPYPENPNRWFAFPIFGGLVRVVLLIPYFIYTSVIQYGAYLGAFAASFVVLFKGVYPESVYEINRDGVRVNQAIAMYMSGLNDSYPSWWISMNHKTIKIILIILGALWFLFGNWHSGSQQNSNQNTYQQSYQQQNQNPGSSNSNYTY